MPFIFMKIVVCGWVYLGWGCAFLCSNQKGGGAVMDSPLSSLVPLLERLASTPGPEDHFCGSTADSPPAAVVQDNNNQGFLSLTCGGASFSFTLCVVVYVVLCRYVFR